MQIPQALHQSRKNTTSNNLRGDFSFAPLLGSSVPSFFVLDTCRFTLPREFKFKFNLSKRSSRYNIPYTHYIKNKLCGSSMVIFQPDLP